MAGPLKRFEKSLWAWWEFTQIKKADLVRHLPVEGLSCQALTGGRLVAFSKAQ
jgi:hypothetical protein